MKPFRLVRRHPWLCLSLLTLLGVGAAFYFFVLREGPINAANFERIAEGMTPAELASLLGEPQSVVMPDDVRVPFAITFHGPGLIGPADGVLYVTYHRHKLPSVTVAYRYLCKDWNDRKRGKTLCWQDGDRAIAVIFDTNDRAIVASFERPEEPPTIWAKVKNWFQNLW